MDKLEMARMRARELRKPTREPISKNEHNKAVQALWATHVEALIWSGLAARDHAAAQHISVYTLRTWCARLDTDPLQVDWRARLHPSIRARISSAAKEEWSKTPSALLRRATAGRTGAASQTPRSSRPGWRPSSRASERPRFAGAIATGIGQRECPQLAAISTCEERLDGKLAPAAASTELQNLLRVPDAELADRRCVFAPAGSDPEPLQR